MKRFRLFELLLVGFSVLGWSLFNAATSQSVLAQGAIQTPTPAQTTVNPHETNDCLGCHSNPDMVGQFADGTSMSLYYDPAQHGDSNHIEGCRACHDAQKQYPHNESGTKSCEVCHSQMFGGNGQNTTKFEITGYEDQRAVTMEINDSCQKCHGEKFKEITDSEHTLILARGNRYAPLCVDCHGSHNITSPNEPRTKIAEICSKCHLSVYTTYESSVHGAAFEADSNPDVPTCDNCHGSHKVTGPTDENFRADSITLCGDCHADKDLMGKYDVSTNVFQTYLDDFHGRTVDFFRQTRDAKITKATCYDCHGIHNIQAPDNELSSVYPSNLQKTCQQCHPDAGITFPQAWLSHYSPTWVDTPVLYAVTTFYRFFVPTIIGGFLVYIALDARRRIAEKLRKRSIKVDAAPETNTTGQQDEKA
ncbi:MAG: hypothetical protein HY863_03340 [Chloroflexi bacterium]|nr:hypothetical protein [Chloroflexota bacterium]